MGAPETVYNNFNIFALLSGFARPAMPCLGQVIAVIWCGHAQGGTPRASGALRSHCHGVCIRQCASATAVRVAARQFTVTHTYPRASTHSPLFRRAASTTCALPRADLTANFARPGGGVKKPPGTRTGPQSHLRCQCGPDYSNALGRGIPVHSGRTGLFCTGAQAAHAGGTQKLCNILLGLCATIYYLAVGRHTIYRMISEALQCLRTF